MRTFDLHVKAALLFLFGCLYTSLAFSAATFSSSPKTSGTNTTPGGSAAIEKMVYGPIQFGFIVDVRGGYWGGTGSNWANFFAQCPAGSVPTTASPPAPAGVAAGQLTQAQFVADAVACGCGQSSRCKPGLMGALGNSGAAVWTRAYCVATVTGYLPESYFQQTATKVGTYYQQKIFTKDSSGNAYIYTMGNDGNQGSGGNKFPGMPEVSGAAVFTWTGHTCSNPG